MQHTTTLLATLFALLLLCTCKKNNPDQDGTLGISVVGSSTCAVSFSSQASNASDFEWDFGDGTPKSTEPNPVHTYACPGDYSVTLKVILNGVESTESKTITVNPSTFKVKYSASGASVIPTADMGFAVFGAINAGQYNAFYFLKTDCSGARVWEKTYSETAIDFARSMVQTRDGGYLFLGGKKPQGSDQTKLFVMKVDSAGNKEWENILGNGIREDAAGIQQTPDDGYIVFGSSLVPVVGSFDFYLVKINKLGQVEWEKTYGGPQNEIGYSVSLSKDGGFAMLGYTNGMGAGGYDTYLVKASSTGDFLWEKTYGGSLDDSGSDIITLADGGYALLGYSQRLPVNLGYDMQLIKINPSGDVEWMNSYDIQGYEVAGSLKQTADGGYILLGSSNGTGTMGFDYFLVKTDAQGAAQWVKTYGEPGSDGGISVAQISDCSGYIMLGVMSNIMTLIKTDKNGNLQ